MNIELLIQVVYFSAAILFIMGLKAMSSPVTARRGIIWAGIGMLVATLISFTHPGMHNLTLMTSAIFVGGIIAWWTGKRVAITDMPQMIALYNGMGGGSAAAIAAIEPVRLSGRGELTHPGTVRQVLALLGPLSGALAFPGSMIAFAKLQGWMRKVYRFKGQQLCNLAVFATLLYFGWTLTRDSFGPNDLLLFFALRQLLSQL